MERALTARTEVSGAGVFAQVLEKFPKAIATNRNTFFIRNGPVGQVLSCPSTENRVRYDPEHQKRRRSRTWRIPRTGQIRRVLALPNLTLREFCLNNTFGP
jgi:hypothetical protein